ncbi:MAG TPA: hypothetical protein PLH75_13420 [Amaricoccus sp.]|uniref:hypothetical protein n=1 Tax=Amaricoccus sp. TaxID=1872485 RepID=UPI001D57FB7C|nr:hypothetical protein [Amaricoccus sp.]MCB1373637.1 hypothetical protein [Paracoccaceae bacterium]MCC0066031.1 hypothetical protein [Rhodovulum sp.]MCB1404067.1 hypothetical protein [Paracoccaceae bacterium]HPG23781.1 hypothetical protein [Amaricoccus sp.]HRW14770.1 hypothetical protein [Amaricoccus sp.]
MQDRALVVLATDARINERLIARGMAPMEGPSLGAILREATGESLASKEALRLWGADRLVRDPRVAAVLRRHVGAA